MWSDIFGSKDVFLRVRAEITLFGKIRQTERLRRFLAIAKSRKEQFEPFAGSLKSTSLELGF
jgi:hypothetical protein